MSFQVFTVTSPVNSGAEGLCNGLIAWLSQIGPITLIDLDVWREDSPTYTGVWRCRILYQVGAASAASWKAMLFRSGSWQQRATGQPAAGQYNALMQGGEPFRPFYAFDITTAGRGSATGVTFILVGLDTTVDPGAPTAIQSFFGQPTAPVAAGDSASVELLDSRGVSLGFKQVRNVGGDVWDANQRTYVVPDILSGEYIAVPTCSTGDLTPFVPPSLTTTTPYQVPAYIPQTKPVTP